MPDFECPQKNGYARTLHIRTEGGAEFSVHLTHREAANLVAEVAAGFSNLSSSTPRWEDLAEDMRGYRA